MEISTKAMIKVLCTHNKNLKFAAEWPEVNLFFAMVKVVHITKLYCEQIIFSHEKSSFYHFVFSLNNKI